MSIPCFDHGQWALPGVKSGKGRASEYRGKTQRYGCGSKLRKHRIMMIYDDLWWCLWCFLWFHQCDQWALGVTTSLISVHLVYGPSTSRFSLNPGPKKSRDRKVRLTNCKATGICSFLPWHAPRFLDVHKVPNIIISLYQYIILNDSHVQNRRAMISMSRHHPSLGSARQKSALRLSAPAHQDISGSDHGPPWGYSKPLKWRF
jgi:hypothetical protein